MRKIGPIVAVLMLALVVVALMVAPALAVNDPHAPGDECSASDQAIGHPAAEREQSDKASPPFSSENPGVSEGAQAGDTPATEHCPNAATE